MAGTIDDAPLGDQTAYPQTYDPGLLFPIERAQSRAPLEIGDALPFHGEDIWNAYEVSWLGPGGLPVVRIGTIWFDAHSPNIIESKSLKLYLNSLNNTRFDSEKHATAAIRADLSAASGAPVRVALHALGSSVPNVTAVLPGRCIDDATTAVDTYSVEPAFLQNATSGKPVFETVYSDLLRSCCPVTGQPDWASIVIRYRGPAIDHQALLRYVVSFRNHADFHEHCVERIFMDIKRYCEPTALSVWARYTRRGGLDINPFRSDAEPPVDNVRHERQ